MNPGTFTHSMATFFQQRLVYVNLDGLSTHTHSDKQQCKLRQVSHEDILYITVDSQMRTAQLIIQLIGHLGPEVVHMFFERDLFFIPVRIQKKYTYMQVDFLLPYTRIERQDSRLAVYYCKSLNRCRIQERKGKNKQLIWNNSQRNIFFIVFRFIT